MAFPQAAIRRKFLESDRAASLQDKGRLLEDIACELFQAVPGIKLTQRNVLNVFAAEEIDVAVWNDGHKNGFPFLPYTILIECKNWTTPVGNDEVTVFIDRLRNRAQRFGIMIVLNGITGNPQQLTAAHFAIATALREGISLVILTREEIESLSSLKMFKDLLRQKILALTASATSILN